MSRPLSIVMPALDEQGNIERAVRHALAAGEEIAGSCEVVAVDDGSRDATGAILERLTAELGGRLRVIRFPENRGYGAALRAGFAAAAGSLVFYTDSDNQFDVRELEGFLPLIESCDAVLGYRIERRDSRMRLLTSRVFNALVSLAFGTSVRDLNCSFKLFRRELLDALQLTSDDFFIDTELIARIHMGGYRYAERGVRHYPRISGRSTVRASDVPRTLVSLARMWLRLRSSPPVAVRRA